MSIIVFGKSPSMEYRWVLRAGERARVGRSPWAEFCIEDDEQLREFHCDLNYGNTCSLVSAVEDAEIRVDKTWTSIVGGREELQVAVGKSRLVLNRRRPDRPESIQSLSDSEPAKLEQKSLQVLPDLELLRAIGVTEPALRLIADQQTNMDSVQTLVEHQLIEDALRYVTACVPVPQRLHWCHHLLHQAGHMPQDVAVNLVQLWLAEPNDSLRQAIAQHVDWSRKLEPVTWFLASIGWTGGSLSSGNSIQVPPTDQMVITGVITALNLAGARAVLPQFQLDAVQQGIEWLSKPFLNSIPNATPNLFTK